MTTTEAPDTFRDVIKATDRGGYLIRSLSRPAQWWLVSYDRQSVECGCEHGLKIAAKATQSPCRHMLRVLAFVRDENARMARPSMPVNVSALCD